MATAFRVLIADQMSPLADEVLSASPAVELHNKAGITADDLISVVHDYDAVLVRSRTKITSEVLAKGTRLKLLGRAGIGVDNIDVAEASKRGVIVENAPSGNAITTAEHAICLLLALVRNVPQGTASMKAGKWEKKKLQGSELYGKTFGVVGLGNIGRIVADRGIGLRMKVVGYDPFVRHEEAAEMGIELLSLDQLLACADFVSIHTPLTDDTEGLIGPQAFSKMKKGAFLVNAARGGIVDEAACLDALHSEHLAGAAFDVFVNEPPEPSHPLLAHERVICTPHLGASTVEAQVKVATEIAQQIRDYAETGEVRNAVNRAPVTGQAASKESPPWVELARRLGRLLGTLSSGEEQEGAAFSCQVAQGARARGAAACLDEALAALLTVRTEKDVNAVSAKGVAEEEGLSLAQSEEGPSIGLRLSLSSPKGIRVVRGEVAQRDGLISLRVIEIDGARVDVELTGEKLLVSCHDSLALVPHVGAILAEEGASMYAMHRVEGAASGELLLWCLKDLLPQSALSRLDGAKGLLSVRTLSYSQ